MKKLLTFMLIAALALCAACSKPADAVDINAADTADVIDVADASADRPEQDDAASASRRDDASDPEYGTKPEATVIDTVAYAFRNGDGATLYGAAEYENTGDCPVRVAKAAFSFVSGGISVSEEIEPVLNQYDVVMPGERSYVACWIADTTLAAGSPVEAAVSLSVLRSEQARIELIADDIYLADNYPGFTTMSGRLRSQSGTECALNLIYTGFYDSDGALLGVWYFTKNAKLSYGDEKRFVVHMRELPIEGLSGLVKQTRTTAFGFN